MIKLNRSFIIIVLLFCSMTLLIYETWGFYSFFSSLSFKSLGVISEEGRIPSALNILVSGIDGHNGLEKARSDIILLVSIQTKEDIAYGISIPRDSRVEIPDYGFQKVNHARVYGGISLLRETIGKLLDVEVDYYAEINFEAFKLLVDELGGVPFTVSQELRDNLTEPHIYVPAGTYNLTGEQSLGVLRFRHYPTGDIDRIKVQQEFFKAFIKEFLKPERLLQIRQLSGIFYNYVRTDLPNKNLIPLALSLRSITLEDVVFKTIPGRGQNIGGLDYWVLDESELIRIKNEYIFRR